MGSGKSSVAVQLKQMLGGDNKTFVLDLDRTGEESMQDIQRALTYENVVVELSNGEWHTTEPQRWIYRFKDKGCTILSVILLSMLEICHKRVKKRGHDTASSDKIDLSFNTFYQKLLTIFAYKSRVKEICINTEQYENEKEMAEEIDRLVTQ
jgi:thymidylate kinase